jgi:hypothetical protein
MISIVSGRWLYRIAVEELESQPVLAVQQSL